MFILSAVLCAYSACGAAWDERGSSENCFLFGLVAPKPASLSCKSAVVEICSILKLEGDQFFILSGIKNIFKHHCRPKSSGKFGNSLGKRPQLHTSFSFSLLIVPLN